MNGDYAVLVDRCSARSGRSWEENHSFLQPIGRNHSDMVKYSEYDDDGGIVGNFLVQFAKAAPTVIKNRIERLESSTKSFLSQPLGKQAETEQRERPLKAKHRIENLERSTGKRSKEKESSDEECQEDDIKTVIAKQRRLMPSKPGITKCEDCLRTLYSEGIDIDNELTRKDGLLLAAKVGHVPLSQYLLDRRTPVEAKDLEGWTRLHWAAFTANLELFRLFLLQGAKYDATTNNNETTLHLASCYHKGHFKTRDTEHYIGNSSDHEAVGLELLNMGLFVDVQNLWGETPLLLATVCGLESMIQLLASKGASVIKGRVTKREKNFRDGTIAPKKHRPPCSIFDVIEGTSPYVIQSTFPLPEYTSQDAFEPDHHQPVP